MPPSATVSPTTHVPHSREAVSHAPQVQGTFRSLETPQGQRIPPLQSGSQAASTFPHPAALQQSPTASKGPKEQVETLIQSVYEATDPTEAIRLLEETQSTLQDHWSHHRLGLLALYKLQKDIDNVLNE